MHVLTKNMICNTCVFYLRIWFVTLVCVTIFWSIQYRYILVLRLDSRSRSCAIEYLHTDRPCHSWSRRNGICLVLHSDAAVFANASTVAAAPAVTGSVLCGVMRRFRLFLAQCAFHAISWRNHFYSDSASRGGGGMQQNLNNNSNLVFQFTITSKNSPWVIISMLETFVWFGTYLSGVFCTDGFWGI